MSSKHVHATHSDIAKRLRRAEGHLRSVVEMIEAGRPCLDIAQQLHAVEKAVSQAKKTLIMDHLQNCLDEAGEPLAPEQKRALKQFQDITKYI
ncbi:MAG TPA: metal resistance protein [Alphaproteobacteria bacterium]|nr:metal resistance protein [Alphaproteobacteria bacterium]